MSLSEIDIRVNFETDMIIDIREFLFELTEIESATKTI